MNKEIKEIWIRKWAKGTPFREWLISPMDEVNITTARVFLIAGTILGFPLGVLITCLIALLIYLP